MSPGSAGLSVYRHGMMALCHGRWRRGVGADGIWSGFQTSEHSFTGCEGPHKLADNRGYLIALLHGVVNFCCVIAHLRIWVHADGCWDIE